MAPGPQRRPEPVPHLPAQIVPVERALRARADAIQADPAELQDAARTAARASGLDKSTGEALGHALATVIAGELRSLADEIHHW